jgi:hypothetical protein
VPPVLEQQSPYPYGILPDGVYPCDEETFRKIFVESFPASRTRKVICAGFFRLRREAAAHGIVAVQWVDGSFVEGKENPNDVDVVHFMDVEFLNALPPPAQLFVWHFLNGREATKAGYHTHTFMSVPSCPPGHRDYEEYEAYRSYWRKWWGTTRRIPQPEGEELPGIRKGFIEMIVGDPAQAPPINRNRGAGNE